MTPKTLPLLDDPAQSAFIEAPGLLIVRLMSRCNNRCTFCMVDEEIHTSGDLPYGLAVDAIARQPAGTKIEFFGGEPTIYPRFLDLLAFARHLAMPCSVATHGRTFASDRFTERVAALGTDQIYIRTSLYGDTPGLHDDYTRVPHSYDQTVRGIRNVVSAGFRSQVNLVIMSRNVERLLEMTRLVSQWGVPRIKFSNLVNVGFCEHDAVPLDVVRPLLADAVALAESLGLRVTVEKTPVCVAGGRLDLMSTERLLGGWPRTHDDEGACSDCLVRRWCDGVDPDYVPRFGFAGLTPLKRLPARSARHSIEEDVEPEFLKVHCVRLASGDVTPEAAARIGSLAERVEAHLGMLAVIPDRFLDV